MNEVWGLIIIVARLHRKRTGSIFTRNKLVIDAFFLRRHDKTDNANLKNMGPTSIAETKSVL